MRQYETGTFFFFGGVGRGGTIELSFLHLEYEMIILNCLFSLPVGYIYFPLAVSFSPRKFLVIWLQSC